MHNNRDRPKQQKQKKSFSFKKLFENLKLKLRNRKQKAPKEQKTKAKNVSFKQRLNNFKAKMKNAFKVKIPKKEKTRSPNKQSSSKLDKTHLTKAIGGVAVILALVAVIGIFGNIGGTKTVVKPVIGGGSVNSDTDYTVTFMGIDSIYATAGVNEGQAVSEPVRPTAEGLYFTGWYDAESGGNIITFPYTPTKDITLYARFTDTVVLGFTGLSDPSGNLTWTDDIKNANSYNLSETGVYVNVSSPLDNVFPFCEIEEFTDSHGNVFVKYPKCYIKYITNAEGVIDGFKVSNVQAEEDMFIPDCFLDPSDPEGYTYFDYFALGKYEMSGTSSKGYSKTNSSCLVDITRSDARSASRSYGNISNYYNGYQLQDYSMTVLYNFLCMTYYKTANIQTVYGGRTGSASSWDSASVTGTTDPIEGLNGWNTATDCVKMLGIENPYGNIFKWIDGIVFNESSIYMFRLPHMFDDSIIGAEVFDYYRKKKAYYISAFKPGISNSTKGFVFPTELDGLPDKYVGDYCYYDSEGTVLACGGSYGGSSYAGLWAFSGSYDASDSSTSVGARLCYRPV